MTRRHFQYLLFATAGVMLVMVFIAQFTTDPPQTAFSQGQTGNEAEEQDGGDCRIVFTAIPSNISSGETGVYRWRYEDADAGTLQIEAPEPSVAKVVAYTDNSVTLRGVERGASEITVSVLCENRRQLDQRIAQSAVVIVDNADPGETDAIREAEGPGGQLDHGDAPDLAPRGVAVIPDNVEEGSSERIRIEVEVHNEGDQPAPATKVTFYQSNNATITSSDRRLAEHNVPALSPSQEHMAVYRFNTPDVRGTYNYGVCVTAVAGEDNSNNNCSPAVVLTVRPRVINPPPPPTVPPTLTPDPEAPEKPTVHTYWESQFPGGGYAEAEFNRVADDEDYYHAYADITRCINNNCTTSTTSRETIQDDGFGDDCEFVNDDDCFNTSDHFVSYSALGPGDSAKVTIYVRACKTGNICSNYDSDAVTYTRPADKAPAPTGLTASNETTTSIRLTWNAVNGAARYRLEYRKSGASSWSVHHTAATTYTVPRLDPGTTYEFRVSARGDGDPYSTMYGNPSGTVTATTIQAVTVFNFSPNPIRLGGRSNVWTVPAHVSSVYVDVNYATGQNKDLAGNINVRRLSTSNTVLSTKVVDDERDSDVMDGATGNSRIRIDVDKDAFDTQFSSVTLRFHSGNSTSGTLLV